MPLDVLLEPAIRQARDGYVVTRSQHELTRDKLPEMGEATGFAQTFLIDGKVPAQGATMKQTGLRRDARSSRQCRARRFLSRRCRARDRRRSRTHRLAGDARRSREIPRLCRRRRCRCKLDVGTLYNAPPPTQGLASLIILALFERLRVAEAESFDFVHGLVESTKRAFRVRDRVVTDPKPHRRSRSIAICRPDFLDAEVQKIDRKKAAPWPAPYGEGDTVWMGAADASGLVVSYIQSIYWEFGSGCVLPRTGVLMQNRGASFSLDKNAVNPLEPGRLPFHTLNPGARRAEGRPRHGLRHHGRRRPAADAGAWCSRATCCSASRCPRRSRRRAGCSAAPGARPHTNLRMECRFDGNLIDRLMSAGHDVEVLTGEPIPTPWAMPAPWCCIRTARMEGAHDPRADPGAYGV